MCGLAGMLGNGVVGADMNLMADLAYVVGLRGMDATGIIQGKVSRVSKNDIFINKSAQEVPYWLEYNRHAKDGNKRILNNIQDNMFLLHVRHGTFGTNTDANAHPFVTGSLISQHNGTLVDAKYRVDKDKTDSEQMFMDMEKRGMKAVIEELDPKSAFAIVSYNKETAEVTFIRNSLRPLYVAVNQERAVLYYCSERKMLELCAYRNGVKLGDILYFEPMRTYTFRPDEVVKGEIPDWRSEKFFQPEPQAAAPANNTSPRNLHTVGPVHTTARSVPRVVGKENEKKDGDDKVVNLLVSRPRDPVVIATGSGLISTTISGPPNKFAPANIPHRTCGYCQKDLNLYQQYLSSRKDGGKTYVCADCTSAFKKLEQDKAEQVAREVRL